MEYHERKYIIDCLNHNFNYDYIDSKLKFYDKNNNPIEYDIVIEYLLDEFEMSPEGSVNMIMRWHLGDFNFQYLQEDNFME
jgi:hypothetical protein